MKKQYNSGKEITFQGTAVYKREGEDVDHLIKRFKKMVQKENILQEYRDRMYYVSPTVKRKLENKECARQLKKIWNKPYKEF